MARSKYLYVIRDEYHAPLSICYSKETAKRQLEVLAKFTECNRGFKITEIRDTVIYFQNYDHVDFVEIPYCGTKKDFMRHFGFVEDYSKIKSALEL
jgi:hypothetical protein